MGKKNKWQDVSKEMHRRIGELGERKIHRDVLKILTGDITELHDSNGISNEATEILRASIGMKKKVLRELFEKLPEFQDRVDASLVLEDIISEAAQLGMLVMDSPLRDRVKDVNQANKASKANSEASKNKTEKLIKAIEAAVSELENNKTLATSREFAKRIRPGVLKQLKLGDSGGSYPSVSKMVGTIRAMKRKSKPQALSSR